jgi:hypothetical protein
MDEAPAFKARGDWTWVRVVVIVLCALPIFYALAGGPVAYLWQRRLLPEEPVRVFFKPLIPLDERSRAYDQYIHWWAEKGRAHR